jgi:hypothetical protein
MPTRRCFGRLFIAIQDCFADAAIVLKPLFG